MTTMLVFLSLLGAAVLFLGYCALVGSLMLRIIGLHARESVARDNVYLLTALAVPCGMLVVIAVLFALGLVGLFNIYSVAVAGAVLLIAAVFTGRRGGFRWAGRADVFRGPWLEMSTVVLLLLVTVLMSMRAPGHWDDTMYQLPQARFYLDRQAIEVNEFLRFPLFPQNINLLLAFGLMTGGDLMAQLMASLPVFVMALGLIGASKLFLGSFIPGSLSAVTIYLLGPLLGTFGNAYIDNGLAMFCWAAVLAMACAIVTQPGGQQIRWTGLAGFMAGAAAGSKLFGLVFAAVLGLYLLLVRRDLREILVYSFATAAVGCWWYVRSFIISGDPMHPALGNIFGFYLWDAGDLAAQTAQQGTIGTAVWNVVAALVGPGVAGWILALASLGLTRVAAPIRMMQFVFTGYLAFWLVVAQHDRYLAPIYAVGTFLSFYFVWRLWLYGTQQINFLKPIGSKITLIYASVLVGLFIPLIGKVIRTERYGTAKWDEVLEGRDGYQLFQKANALRVDKNNRLMHLGYENAVFFYDGVAVGDHFGPGRYRRMLGESGALRSPQKIQELMKNFGATAFAVNTQRFPSAGVDKFFEQFDVIDQTEDGYLLVPKNVVGVQIDEPEKLLQ